jgi:hypothetical protein
MSEKILIDFMLVHNQELEKEVVARTLDLQID